METSLTFFPVGEWQELSSAEMPGSLYRSVGNPQWVGGRHGAIHEGKAVGTGGERRMVWS